MELRRLLHQSVKEVTEEMVGKRKPTEKSKP